MNRRTFAAACAWALTLAFAAGAAPLDAGPAPVVVDAAASLREAFTAAAAAFTKETGDPVTFNFGGSDTLEQQIAQGAPVDVFASANSKQMKLASDGGLLATLPATFARNRLVLIVPSANPAGIVSLADIAKPNVKVVLGAATVPVGGYARQAFLSLDGQGDFPPDFASRVEKNVVSNELDVKAVATKISLGEADAGVVYATDVTPAIAPTVKVIAFPAGASPDVTYPIAVLKGAPNPAGARAFVTFVLGDGQKFLKADGFLPP